MPLWRCSGIWSQILRHQNLREQARPGRPRSIGRLGIGAWTIVSQARQLSFGPDMTDHLEAGRDVFQHLAVVLADTAEHRAAATRAGAGRLVGDGLARQMRRQRLADRMFASGFPSLAGLAGGGIVGGVARLGCTGFCSSSSPMSNSSCSIAWSSFSEERPKRARRNTASCIFSFSMCSVLAWISAALAAISISLRASSACKSTAKLRSATGSSGSGRIANDIDAIYGIAI